MTDEDIRRSAAAQEILDELRGLVEAPPQSAVSQVATTQFHLAEGAPWTDVGASPMMLMSRQAVVYMISDEPPEGTPDGDDGFRLEPRITQTIILASRVWAASAGTGEAVLTVAGPVK